MRSPYEALGVSSKATQEEIKAAFREIALKKHPDRTGDDAELTSQFKEACEAFKILSDPEKRRAYDRGFHPVSSTSDLFLRDSIGRRVMAERLPTAPAAPKPGTDLYMHVELSAAMLRNGGVITIKLPVAYADGTDEIAVTVPEGAHLAPWCQLANLGTPGKNNGSPGDLWIFFTEQKG